MTVIEEFGTDAGAPQGLASLLADAAQIRLPAPRTPRAVVIDLTVPAAPTAITIPGDAAGLVDGYGDYGA